MRVRLNGVCFALIALAAYFESTAVSAADLKLQRIPASRIQPFNVPMRSKCDRCHGECRQRGGGFRQICDILCSEYCR